MGFTYAPPVTKKAVVSYTALPPLPDFNRVKIRSCLRSFRRTCHVTISVAVYFCCTFLGVASTGRYPAFCPMKPRLSSPAAFRHLQPRSFVLLILKLKERRKNFATPLNIHYSFNFRKKIFFARKFFSQEIFFARNFLDIKAASADKFPQNGVLIDSVTWHWKEIIQKLQKSFRL